MNIAFLFNLALTTGALFLIVLSAAIYISSYSENVKLSAFATFFKRRALFLILLASFAAVAGSIIYSEIFKFEPCILCWWQRIFIYPVFIISLVALIKKDRISAFQYISPLMWIALLFSLYHNYIIVAAQSGGTFLCDPATTASCTERYVGVLSVIDIPFMALAVILFVLALSSASLKALKKSE